eukprot:1382800-Amorphochlora_amoeboformis.AAC.1
MEYQPKINYIMIECTLFAQESALRLLKEDRSARMGIPFTRGSANSNVNCSNSSKDSNYAHIGSDSTK